MKTQFKHTHTLATNQSIQFSIQEDRFIYYKELSTVDWVIYGYITEVTAKGYHYYDFIGNKLFIANTKLMPTLAI